MDLLTSTSYEGVEYRNILTVTDRLIKERHLLLVKSMTAQNTVRLFLRYVFLRYGLPDSITSDRGPQFVSTFWTLLCKLLQIEQKLSSAYYPETDG